MALIKNFTHNAKCQRMYYEESELPRPPPPICGKVTHFSIELEWDDALDAVNKETIKGDGRVKVCLQEADNQGTWGNLYTGYAKKHTVSGLDPQSEYKYRMRFMNNAGHGDWSPHCKVSTTKEPMNGEHLHKALERENLGKMKEILDSGDVKIDVPNKYGFSPLMFAAIKNYEPIAKCLLDYGADVHLKNDAGKTALMLGCYAGSLETVQLLRKHGAKYNDFDRGGSAAIHWAVDGENAKLLEWMIDDGADKELKDLNCGWTPLIRCASVSGNRDIAAALIRNKVDVNIQDKDKKTALMLAVLNNHYALIEILLQRGADLSIRNEYGKTAVDMAVSMEKRRAVKLLTDHMEKHNIKLGMYSESQGNSVKGRAHRQ